jgi:hypothetical protein
VVNAEPSAELGACYNERAMETLVHTRRKHACRVAASAGVLAVMLAGTALAQNTTRTVVTFKLNLEKSTFSPGPPPRSMTATFETFGTTTRVVSDQVQADGSLQHWEFIGYYDGKDSVVTGNNPDADVMVRTRISPGTVKTVWKKGGKVTTTHVSVLSSDRRTRTITSSGTNAAGHAVNNVMVLERQ